MRVVPVEELLAVSASVLNRAETIGEVGSVLQGFELRLGVRIVIRDVRAAVGLGDIEVNEERGDGLRSHAGAAIGMEREGSGSDVFLLQGVGDELLSEVRGLPMSEQLTDDVAAVDVEDHVEMEAGPFGRALQFGDIPGPHFVGNGYDGRSRPASASHCDQQLPYNLKADGVSNDSSVVVACEMVLTVCNPLSVFKIRIRRR
jgi:hypothetical protein